MNELRELVRVANAALVESGCKVRERFVDGHAEYSMYIPSRPRPIVVTARVAMPSDAVGKIFKGKFAKKAKTIAKKIAKSKVLGKIAKIAPMIAAVVPGGQAFAAGAAAVVAAKKIAKAAKAGNPKAKKFAAAAAKEMTVKVQRARSVTKAAPGYPQQLASTQPQPQNPGNFGASSEPQNFGDADPAEMEAALDQGQGGEEVEVDASAEQGEFGEPDADWPGEDEPADDDSDSDASE